MRQRRYKPKPLREEKKLLIVANGKTEEEYFCQFPVRGQLLRVLLWPSIDNRKLLRKAVEAREKQIRENKYLEDIDETWIVIDRDSHAPNPRDRQDFERVLRDAEGNNVKVAYSNNAFELWYLLHFKYEKDTLNTAELTRRLNKELGKAKTGYTYRKPAPQMYELIHYKQEKAIQNAEKLYLSHKDTPPVDANPSTTVHKLVEILKSMRRRQ